MEQLFIAKTDSEWQMFDSARPISKMSCVYKVLDTVLKNRLWKNVKETNQMSMDQIGFIPGLSTETNLLKIMEEIRINMKDI